MRGKTAITDPATPSSALDDLLQLAIQISHASGGVLLRHLPEDDQLHVIAQQGAAFNLALAKQAFQQMQPLQQIHGNQLHVYIPFASGVLGLIVLDHDAPVTLLGSLAKQADYLINAHQTIAALQNEAEHYSEQVEELEFIRNADRELTSQLDPARVVRFTLDWALRRTAADAGMLITVEQGDREPRILEYIGYQAVDQVPQSIQKGIIRRSIKQRQTQIIPDVHADPDYVILYDPAVSMIVVPLISHNRVIGALRLESKQPHRFDPAAVAFVERIAGMAAVALDNARLLKQAEQLADDLALIHSGGRTISSSLEFELAIEHIAQSLALAVKDSSALIYRYQPTTRQTILLSTYRAIDQTKIKLPDVGSPCPICELEPVQQVLQGNRLITLQPSDDTPAINQWLHNLGAGIAALLPLFAQGEALGLAILMKTRPPFSFAESEMFVAESLASHAAVALRQSLLYAEVRDLEIIKSEMIRMASHDLRSPIANAAGYLGLLESDVLDERYDQLPDYIAMIRRSMTSMENLVRDLLTLEEIESHRGRQHKTVLFNVLLQEVLEEQQSNASFKQQHMASEIEAGAYPVYGNHKHLRQAIVNLIGNAIKYTPEGGSITITLKQQPDTPQLTFTVVDTGYGIAPERQQRIFQRFYRAKQPGTEHITGTGLGLSLVKSIIERHQGEVFFQSEPGHGSTFGFHLPLQSTTL